MEKKTNRESGLMTVEAVLSLVPFIIVILGIISFTNIFLVHNKIQYALYQMGNELSCYTYFYQALGLRSADLGLKADIDANTESLDETLENLDSFLSQIEEFESSLDGGAGLVSDPGSLIGQGEGIIETGGELVNSSRDLLSDPKALLRSFVYLGIEEAEGAAKGMLLSIISGGLMDVYLDESFAGYHPMTAEEYLSYFGVADGLDFGNSELFTDDEYRMIDMVAEYDVEVYILKLFLKDPTIHVVQRCAVPAWLDGEAVCYEGR